MNLASKYTNAGTSFANPHAVTSMGNGLSTTTYAYDNNGNLTSAGNGTATSTYSYDYSNRLVALFTLGATTTYGYDAFGARVYQIVATTSTSTYPFKFFSIASTTKSSTNYATSTEYVFNGDTLLSTVDQAFKNGTATGTAAVRYVHADHLGPTNVVTDQNQNLVQTLNFYPYGATRVSVSTSTNEKRKFIGQFLDDSNLEYLNARYYNPAQGQFISQDPVFWELGLTNDGKTALTNPQAQNSYGYASDNPITNKDPSGRFWWEGFYDWRGYNGWQGVVMKAGEVLGGHDRALNAMQTYQGTINADSQKYGVSFRLTNAIVYEEQSHLMPDEALGREQLLPNIGNGGVGVMQVSGPIGKKFGNYSKTDLARDPLKNIDAGTAYLSSIQNTFSSPTRYAQTTGIGAAYNGSSAYGQRIAAQASSPNYNRNVFVAGLQSLVSSLQKLISTLQK